MPSGRNKNKRSNRQRAGKRKAEVAIVSPAGNQVSLELQLGELPPPSQTFAADAVLLQDVPALKCVNLFFVAATPSMSRPHTAVRVRVPYTWLTKMARRDAVFLEQLEKYVESAEFGEPWQPPIEQLDDLSQERIVIFDAAFLTMAHFAESSVCDVYAVPADFAIRHQTKREWHVEAILRVTLPTVVLHRMVVGIKKLTIFPGTLT